MGKVKVERPSNPVTRVAVANGENGEAGFQLGPCKPGADGSDQYRVLLRSHVAGDSDDSPAVPVKTTFWISRDDLYDLYGAVGSLLHGS